MTKYSPQWYKSPIDLPEKVCGKMQIAHRRLSAGHEVNVIGARQAMLRGLRHTVVKLPEPLVVHELREIHGDGRISLWMTDLPEELNQIEELIANLRIQGDVLIGGLGLGILATRVAQLPDVMNVTVVERSQDVIKLCTPPTYHRASSRLGKPPTYDRRVVHMDIQKYLTNTEEKFDFYLLDTWAGTNEGAWWEDVFPLRRLIRQRWGISPELHCWAEDIMWGQIYRSLTNPSARPHWYYSYLPVPMRGEEAEAFLNMVGTPWWEKKYGGKVDRYLYESKNPNRRPREEVTHTTAGS